MLLEKYEELETYREIDGWHCALALDKQRQQSVGVYRFPIDSAVSQDTVQEYVENLRLLSEHPHPSIVSVLEVAIESEQLVVVADWLEAEDLTARKDRGLSFDQIASMTESIGSALEHLHSHGIVHRSIRPASVLFAIETQAVRLDVPLWRISSLASTSAENQAYYAPEVRTQQRFSPASDFYAVGMLLYSIVLGSFPWTDQRGVPRVRAEEDTVPRLPVSLQSIQPVIDDLLAFNPAAREYSYENVLKFNDAERTSSMIASDVRYRSGAIDIAEVQMVSLPFDQPATSTSDGPSARSRFWLYSTLTTVAVIGILVSLYAYTNFDGVRMLLYEIGFVDHPELSERWRQAESSRLDPTHDLITVIAAYNKVLELMPGHSGAQQAIANEKRERRDTIESLIKADEFALAQTRLDEYVTAVPNDAEIAPLVTELENRQRRDRLLLDARPLVAAGIQDPALLEAAVLTYKTVLSVFPESDEARSRLNDIAVMYAEAAIQAANEAEIDDARDFFEKAKEADPDAQELEEARHSVELAESLETEINTTIQSAKELFDKGYLITPPGEANAMSTYRQVLAIDPDNEQAQNKLVEIEELLILEHQGLLEDREFGAETDLVGAARSAGVSEATLKAMSDARESLRQDIEEAVNLYQKALSLYQRGYISGPTIDNAIEVLKQALALDAKNTNVQELLNQCAERTATVAEEAYRAGLVDRAKEYMKLALGIQPMNDAWSKKYQQWTQVD